MNKLLRRIKAVNEISLFLSTHAYGIDDWSIDPCLAKMLDEAAILKDKIIVDEEWCEEKEADVIDPFNK